MKTSKIIVANIRSQCLAVKYEVLLFLDLDT